jgi:hypothetical protein
VQVPVTSYAQKVYTRKVPITTYRVVDEEHVEQVPVQVCRMVAETQTVNVPHVVQKQIPVTYRYCVPKTVVRRVPVETCMPTICCEPAYVAPPITYPDAATAPAPSNQAPPAQGGTGTQNGDTAPQIPPNQNVPGPIDEEAANPPTA